MIQYYKRGEFWYLVGTNELTVGEILVRKKSQLRQILA